MTKLTERAWNQFVNKKKTADTEQPPAPEKKPDKIKITKEEAAKIVKGML